MGQTALTGPVQCSAYLSVRQVSSVPTAGGAQYFTGVNLKSSIYLALVELQTLFSFFLNENNTDASYAKWKKLQHCFVSCCVWFLLERSSCIQRAHGWPGCLSESQFFVQGWQYSISVSSPPLSLQLHLAEGSNPQLKKLIRTIMSASLLTG